MESTIKYDLNSNNVVKPDKKYKLNFHKRSIKDKMKVMKTMNDFNKNHEDDLFESVEIDSGLKVSKFSSDEQHDSSLEEEAEALGLDDSGKAEGLKDLDESSSSSTSVKFTKLKDDKTPPKFKLLLNSTPHKPRNR